MIITEIEKKLLLDVMFERLVKSLHKIKRKVSFSRVKTEVPSNESWFSPLRKCLNFKTDEQLIEIKMSSDRGLLACLKEEGVLEMTPFSGKNGRWVSEPSRSVELNLNSHDADPVSFILKEIEREAERNKADV